VYVHDFAVGKWFWSFDAVPGYHYAADQAADGHVSLIIDSVGYDDSSRPQGHSVCMGSQADMTHQVVDQLRAGSYTPAVGAPSKFARIALAGHAVGGALAQIVAYSYGGIDALLVMSWADQGSSDRSGNEFAAQASRCAAGGELSEAGGSGGYAYFGQSDEDFREIFFHDTDPAVATAATALRNRDPCGETLSLIQAIGRNQQNLGSVTVPVLLVYGRHDALMNRGAEEEQKARYSGSSDVTLHVLPNSGVGLTLEREHDLFRRIVHEWLAQRGL
jgi:pimeloyl-ACP methyl ester carboxylesterase